jgi:hypothetical protein
VDFVARDSGAKLREIK